MSDWYHRTAWKCMSDSVRLLNRLSAKPNHSASGVIFDTSIHTDNLGDQIIMHYCDGILSQLFSGNTFHHISTHCPPDAYDEVLVKSAAWKFVCGTNLMTSQIEKHWGWELPAGFRGKLPYRNTILLGTGWKEYQTPCSDYSAAIYRMMLHPGFFHAVRDSYTEKKLQEIGIRNVLNTGCPTMWHLTPDFCEKIPSRKANEVITTLTDYRRDTTADQYLLDTVGKLYNRVYLWPQGRSDIAYLETLRCPENLTILPRTYEAFDALLSRGQIDYVGTRLHGGIFALNHQIRSLVIAVDNRAIEIASDTKLPILLRAETEEKLQDEIQRDRTTEIQLHQSNIDRFLEQFKGRLT